MIIPLAHKNQLLQFTTVPLQDTLAISCSTVSRGNTKTGRIDYKYIINVVVHTTCKTCAGLFIDKILITTSILNQVKRCQ